MVDECSVRLECHALWDVGLRGCRPFTAAPQLGQPAGPQPLCLAYLTATLFGYTFAITAVRSTSGLPF